MSPLEHRPVVVVTGASKGIGLAVARILLDELSAIVVAISRTRTPELVQLSHGHHDTLLVITADVSNETALTSAISLAAKTYGHIDALILNAAMLEPLGNVIQEQSTTTAWKKHFDVNFFSLITAIQAAAPHLRQSKLGGRVVFTSSGSAVGATAGWAPYNASKAAMNSLCRTIANEEPNITFVALRPGMVDTPMQAVVRKNKDVMTPEDAERFIQAHAEGKLVKPEDAGYVLSSLAISAPKAMSGKFVSWDSDDCADFRRKQPQRDE